MTSAMETGSGSFLRRGCEYTCIGYGSLLQYRRSVFKATPTAAVAKFAAAGKRVRKKDLGLMAMSYGYVYVAQIAMGANMNQTIKAMVEAESYKGPSLIIAYSPCISHGIKTGMGTSIFEEKRAVEAGYCICTDTTRCLKSKARIRLFWSRKNRPLLTRSSSREKSDIHSLRMYSRCGGRNV